jgi:hypothetical protein
MDAIQSSLGGRDPAYGLSIKPEKKPNCRTKNGQILESQRKEKNSIWIYYSTERLVWVLFVKYEKLPVIFFTLSALVI